MEAARGAAGRGVVRGRREEEEGVRGIEKKVANHKDLDWGHSAVLPRDPVPLQPTVTGRSLSLMGRSHHQGF